LLFEQGEEEEGEEEEEEEEEEEGFSEEEGEEEEFSEDDEDAMTPTTFFAQLTLPPTTTQPTMPQTQPAPPVEAPREEKTEAPTAEPPLMETPPVTQTATLVSRKMRLTRIKGIGEKRVAQLNSLGINNIKELAEASAEDIAKNLQISPKITQKWIAAAKELVK
jgi:predicted flap endonuclease-1-like 5' DNA nuclease